MSTRFACTPSGSVESDRKRLFRGLLALTGLVLALAIWLAIQGTYGSAVVLTIVAALTTYAARMSRDLDLLWIDVEDDRQFALQLRRKRLAYPRPSAARRLNEAEIRHLSELTRWSGFQAATGGYDSSVLGEIEFYTSNLKTPVLISWDEERIVVSPDDADGLVDALTDSGPTPSLPPG